MSTKTKSSLSLWLLLSGGGSEADDMAMLTPLMGAGGSAWLWPAKECCAPSLPPPWLPRIPEPDALFLRTPPVLDALLPMLLAATAAAIAVVLSIGSGAARRRLATAPPPLLLLLLLVLVLVLLLPPLTMSPYSKKPSAASRSFGFSAP